MDAFYARLQQDPDGALKRLQDDPTVSFWVKDAITALSHRDLVDVLQDLDLLLNCFEARFDTLIDRTPQPRSRLRAVEAASDAALDSDETAADQFPGHLLIGGTVPEMMVPNLIDTLAQASVCLGWDDPFFVPQCEEDLYQALDTGNRLHVFNARALGGSFPFLEAWLVTHRIAFDRYSEAHGVRDAELLQYRPGMRAPIRLPVNAEQQPIVVRQLVTALVQRLTPDTAHEVLEAFRHLLGPSISPLTAFRVSRTGP